MTTLPPTFFYDPECCDDNRYDMRPWFYATDWKYQFEIIDERVNDILANKENELIRIEHRKKSVVDDNEDLACPEIHISLPRS